MKVKLFSLVEVKLLKILTVEISLNNLSCVFGHIIVIDLTGSLR